MTTHSRHTRRALVGAALLLAAGASFHPSHAASASSVRSDVGTTHERAVQLSQLPLEVHRRAATLLQQAQNREDSRWSGASFDPEVTPVWRPDKAQVAYWEIRLRTPTGSPAGYMLLANDRDDYPAPMWTEDGLAPSEELDGTASTRPARIVMPTVGTFVAEDEQGREIARLGDLPPRIEGYDPSWIDAPPGSFHTQVEVTEGRVDVFPPKVETNVTLGSWPSWAALTEEYRQAYAPQLELLRREAAPDWRIEDLLARHGEVLLDGHARVVPLLDRGDPEVQVSGPGLAYARVEALNANEHGYPALHVLVDGGPTDEPAALDIELRYPSGERETVKYMIAQSYPLASGSSRVDPIIPAGLTAMQVSAVPASGGGSCIRNGGRVSFRTNNGRFLSPRANGTLTAVATTPEHTSFRLEQLADGRWALRAENTNKYMVAEGSGGGIVNANRDHVGAWEKFAFVIRDGGRKVAIRAANGEYVVAEGGGGGEVNANRKNIGSWEEFTIACDPGVVETWTGGHTKATSWSAQRKYRQIDSGTAPNTDSQCSTGCGPTAWAMLIGWSDLMASRGTAPWTPHWGLYRQNGSRNGADAIAPERNDSGIDAITIELRSYMNDWAMAGCGANGRWTAPHIMAQAHQYFGGRASTSLTADYDGAGISTGVGVRKAVDAIRVLRRPVIIGTGHFAHYPVAFGLLEDRYLVYDRNSKTWVGEVYRQRFEVNWGWAENNSRNVPTSTWFQGFLHPNGNKKG